MSQLPSYLNVTRDALGQGQPVALRVVGDMADLASAMAAMLFEAIASRPAATLIVPVGPVDQFPILAGLINDRRFDCRDVVFINMDEYLTDDDQLIDASHPLCFRSYVARKFYDLLDPDLAPPPAHRVFPDPDDPDAIGRLIAGRGGVDVCFGGIGINGHIAFNEPPEPGVDVDVAAFAARPTRCLDITRETRTINANTVGGEISIIPRRCITVGMKEILASRRLRFFCNRPWQSAVVRRVLHGPVTSTCPASLLRTHDDAMITVTDYVADPPDIRLR